MVEVENYAKASQKIFCSTSPRMGAWDNGHFAAAYYQMVSNYYGVVLSGIVQYHQIVSNYYDVVLYSVIKWSLIIMIWYCTVS